MKEGGERTLVNENETQVIAGGVFLVDFAKSGSEVKAAQEQANGDCFSF